MERSRGLAQQVFALRKHSNSVKRRLFRTKWHYDNVIKPATSEQQQLPLEPLKFQPTYTPPRVLPNGWTAPPELGTPLPKDKLPFQVGDDDPYPWRFGRKGAY